MAKFCTKCGKKLEDGEVCSCTKTTAKKANVKEAKVEKKEKVEKVETTTVVTASPSPANDYVNNYMEVAKGIFTHPIDTMKKFGTSEHFTLGLIMIAINCLITVLFVYLGFKELMSNMGDFGSIFSMGYGYGDVEVPMEVLVKIFVMMAGGFATTAAMLYVIAGPILKTNADIKQAFALVGVCSVLTTITTIVALICMYISTKLMLIVLLVCGVLYLAHLYHGFLNSTEVEENKIGYTYVASVAVATFVVVYLLPKILF